MSPYDLLYCRTMTDLGTLGRKLDPPDYRLFTDTVKEDMILLKEALDTRIQNVETKIKTEKEKYLAKINSKRTDKPTLKQGTIVFIRNYSIPKNGRARKFRPYYLRSPQIVMTSSKTSIVTLRLADNFISRHHPDDAIEYKGNEKDTKLFNSLPQEVLAFLGKPLSKESLTNLAKQDKLDIIYTDRSNPNTEPIMTRSKSQQQKSLEQAMELVRINEELDDLTEDEAVELNRQPSKEILNLNNIPSKLEAILEEKE